MMATGGVVGGVPGGVPGGQMGGVIGGIISSTPVAVPKVATPQRVRVSQGVSQGLLVEEGTAQLSAAGPPSPHSGTGVAAGGNQQGWHHRESAPDQRSPHAGAGRHRSSEAVAYKPYFLNGEPVEVETQITVNFTLSGG